MALPLIRKIVCHVCGNERFAIAAKNDAQDKLASSVCRRSGGKILLSCLTCGAERALPGREVDTRWRRG